MAKSDREHWDSAYARKSSTAEPAPFVVEHAPLLPRGRVLDLASGSGRNACFLAERGLRVVAVDASKAALTNAALASHPRILRVLMDLDAPAFRSNAFDAIVNVNFLDRRLFAVIDEWLRPGGILMFDTFLVDQAQIGHPRNRAFLLDRNELLARLSTGYRVLRYREGLVTEGGQNSHRAGVVAERRAD